MNTGSITQILDISDTHCGSELAILPPSFRLHNNRKPHFTDLNGWLWECWEDWQGAWADKYIRWDECLLVINGDATEGVHHGGKQIVSDNPLDHVTMAEHLFAPLVEKAADVVVVEGTECHTGSNEHSLALKLGAIQNPNTGQPAWDRLVMDVQGTRCHFSHHMPTTSRPYLEGNGLSITLGTERQEAVINGEKPPQVVGKAHRHRYGEFLDAAGHCFATPPWQGLTRHGHKVVSAARTRPGVVLLDWQGKDEGELPDAHRRIYKAPQPKVLTL